MTSKKAIVIGGGPAGASAAFRLKQGGAEVLTDPQQDRTRTFLKRILDPI